MARLGPGDVGPKKPTTSTTKAPTTVKKNTKDIWDAEEVQEGAEYDDVYDTRPQPE